MKIESDSILGSRKLQILLKSDEDGVYNWPQNSHNRGRGSETPAAHTKQKTPPPHPPVIQVTRSLDVFKIEQPSD